MASFSFLTEFVGKREEMIDFNLHASTQPLYFVNVIRNQLVMEGFKLNLTCGPL